MDSALNAALEEICTHVEDGISLESLFSKLQSSSTIITLTPSFQQSIFTNLLRIPTLRFQPPNPNYDHQDHHLIKIFPQQTLADNFVGIYNPQSLQQPYLRVLHLLANAKHNGITQTQLAKLLRIGPNNFHYVLRTLECKGLIVKRSALEKKTQIHTSSSSSVNYTPLNITTHLVYLRRYANKPLTNHQRFEFQITQFNQSQLQTDVRLADYEPPMKAISDKLANANGKVLLVSDIKKDLGYCGSRPKQRAWRQIAARLKAHQIVEQFDAKVNGKIEACLRLLDPITTESGNEDKNSDSGNVCQVTDQLVELPIEHQMFDIIDTAGSDGITIKEICDRLQIDLKKNHIRLLSLCHRFEMKVQEEQCLKFKTYRVWTSRNFNPELEVALTHKLEENKILDQPVCDSSSKIRTEFEASTFKGELVDPDKLKDIGAGVKLSCASSNNVESTYVETPTNLQESIPDQRGTIPHNKPVSLPMEGNIAISEAFPSDALTPISAGSYQRYSSLSLTADGTKKAIRILERLKDERFVLRPELNRWLNTFEKDKSKKVDHKTLDRILTKLQEQGQCKCITIRTPVIAKYSKTTDCVIVVHPSLSLSPELHDEMQDKVRTFKNYIHSKSTRPQKNDKLIPVMEDIQKTQSLIVPGRQVDKSEAMRANGFIVAKMIRAKLLHIFLWDYLHRSENCSDALSSNGPADNPHSSSKLFSLDAAINAIPVELFLQVAGSTKKYEEMIDKCKKGLCLSDLPAIDTLAIGRLSLIIDILRRLKLIRVITSQSRDGVKTPHPLTHMMELRPYIEEPLSNDAASLNFMSLDIRPRIRHDFVLSNRCAVDEYWRTLEYCYAASNRKAALYAFPGSVVHEVFRFRSWASNRLMTAEQRAELLKHVTKHDLSEKISYRDCEKIAKDLNLTLEQVLSMYYSKRRHGLNQFNDKESEDNSLERKGNSSRRRKKDSPELRPAKHARIDAATGVMDKNIDEQHNMGIHSEEQVTHVQEFEEVNYEIEGSQDCSACISKCILTAMKPPRQSRFIWSDKTDRQLVIQYVRHRAVLGANYHRVDWASLSDLPAPPRACMRRMNFLNANLRFRKAVNKLCTMLSERYAKQLEKSQNLSSNKDDCRLFVQSRSSKGVHNSFSPDVVIQMSSLNGEVWDNFENKSIETALDEILRCKKMAKLDASSQNDQSRYEDWNRYESRENGKTTAAIPSEIIQSRHGKTRTFSSQRSLLDMKFSRFLNNRPSIYGQVNESLAVSNAVELFKLVFLSTATSPQAPNLLADILRHYSEHDLVAAFNYFREKKIMVGGNGSDEQFELSLRFLDSVSKSPFPFDTGKQAVKFSAWLKERDKDLTEIGTDLVEDLQCGDTFNLFALISSGELSISPSLPDNGVGEADELRSGKRKSDASGSSFSVKAKKLKSSFGLEGEIISRREKGFPGIIISVRRTEVSKADILDLFRDNDNNNNDQHFDGNVQLNMDQSSNYSLADHMLETFNSCDPVPEEKDHIESPWESMAGYVRHLITVPSSEEQECAVCAEVFVVVYAALQKAGDQGLSMGEISQVINLPGADVDGLIVDALQAFGKALKVNAYDSVRIVDALYRHKYFLTTVSGFHPVVQPSSNKTIKKSDNTCKLSKSKESDSASADVLRERNTALDNVHKVTILNLPQEDVDPENKACDRNEGCMQDGLGSSRGDHEKEMVKYSSGELCMPILPWINGDGTVNSIVFKGLRRRVLGIVMQNPGILEVDILRQMHVLNPQSCRTLLELMVLDKLLTVRKMYQNRFGGGPSMLQNLIGSKSCQRKWICPEHFFANPMSTSLLQLVIQYVRHRAVLGANYHRVDWASLSDLPAPPRACMRRMNFLNANLRFRKAVNKLCTMLSERYAKQLEKSQNLSSNKDDCRLFVQSRSSKGVHNSFSPDVVIQMSSLNGEVWDNFENKSIETALDEILRCKKMAKLDASSQNDQSRYEDWNRYESRENGKTTAAIPSEIIQSRHGKTRTFSSQRSLLDMKFSRFLNNRPSIYGQVNESLAVSNAVELFKLVFLSTATSPQAPNLLADILRHYSEHDLVAAFNYFREKKIMVGGNGSDEQFELSLRFLDSVSKSPFPFDTGKQAVKFSAWLKERDKDLTEIGTDLVEDLQCGDTFNLFALISSGELSISPSLPDNGVGEADELRSGKRKSDASGSSFSVKAKKLKSSFGLEGEIISRREKGFPGIIISVRRTEVSKADILDLFRDNDNNNNDQHFDGNVQLNMDQSSNYSLADHMLETFNSCDPVPEEKDHIESPWESMAGYVRHLITVPSSEEQECAVCAEVFVVVYAALQKAGDQGLSMGEISQVINLPGADVDGLIVDALQAFGKALKVNAYDSVRIVDALYRHKYFLTTVSGFHPVVQPSSNKTIKKSDNTCKLSKSKESDSASADVLRERNTALDNVHKVTILNLPQEDVDPENKACDRNEGCMQDGLGSSRGDHEKEMVKYSSGELCMPILPWINGDGTVNSIVFKGLRRRVLGIVMQNPGILEVDILRQMHVLNPQSCRTLLELMVLDKLLTVRKMYQNRFGGGPSMLQNLIGSKSCQRKWICPEHFFANPMSTSLL